MFDGARTQVIGDSAATLRAVIVSGGELRIYVVMSPEQGLI